MKIAALLTCFNRKTKTEAALVSLKAASTQFPELALDTFLTDDGSTDGTAAMVEEKFPDVHILKGNGALYWAGGMRLAWNEAIKRGNYDGYLLINDDTVFLPNLFELIQKSDRYAIENFDTHGIYIGSTRAPESLTPTYGGSILLNKLTFNYKLVIPNDNPQPCDLGNANIMYVSSAVVDRIGILHSGYKHGIADYDYTLTAVRNNIPVLIMPEYAGNCENDHAPTYKQFDQMTFSKRWKYMKHPLGLDLNSNLLFMRRHFPWRFPLVLLAAGLKLIFPKFYMKNRVTK